MKTALVFCVLLCAHLQTSTRQEPEHQASAVAGYEETVDRILAEAVARGQAYSLLSELCEAAPHRLSGSDGAARAIDWAEARMKSLGFEKVRREPCVVPVWVRGDVEELTFETPEAVRGDHLPIAALGGSIATPEAGLAAAVIEVRNFDELERRAEEARGKIVFFNHPMDPENIDPFSAYGLAVTYRVHGASRAARVGAVAALVRSVTTSIDDFPHTGAMRYDPRVPQKVPTAAISTRGSDDLSALIARGEEVRMRLSLSCETQDPVPSWNVVGELVGHEKPEEIVLVGGHLDCWDIGQGAHDDGAGSCESIEVVRLLGALDLRPRRTIRVVLFMNEENGLGGAHAYRQDHLEELGDHVFALESDRGGFAPNGFTCDAGPGALPTVRAIGALLDRAGADTIRRGGGGADVSPMARDGVITAGLLPVGQRYFDYHHSERDRIEAIHPREINLAAGVMAAMCYVIADLPQRLPPNR